MERKIIRTYLLISSLFTLSASLIWGINTLFLLSSGLNIFQVFLVNGIYTASMALFEIPTGVVADTLGRRTSFLASAVVLLLGTLGYVFAAQVEQNLGLFIFMSVVLGISFTFYSGAVEAWVVDALHTVNKNYDLEGVFSKGAGVSAIAMLVGTVSGGLLGTINLRIPYVVRASIVLIVFFIALAYMKDIGYEPKTVTRKTVLPEMKKIWDKSIQYGVKQASINRLMRLSLLFGTFMMWGWYAWQPYFLELYGDPSAVWVAGLISAAISLAMAVASFAVPTVVKRFKKRSAYLKMVYGIMAILIFMVGISGSFFIAVPAYILFAFFMGLSGPVKQTYFHRLVPSEERATVVSFDSLVASAGGVAGQPVLGYLSNTVGIGVSYQLSSFIVLLTVPVLRSLTKQNDPCDVISQDPVDDDDNESMSD